VVSGNSSFLKIMKLFVVSQVGGAAEDLFQIITEAVISVMAGIVQAGLEGDIAFGP